MRAGTNRDSISVDIPRSKSQNRRIRKLARVVATTRHRANIALGKQLAICILDGNDTDTQMTRKGALRRQMLPRRNTASNNIIANLLVNILIKRCFAAIFQIVVKHGSIT